MRRTLLLLVLLLGAFAVIACSSDDNDGDVSTISGSTDSVSSSGPVAEDGAGNGNTTIAATLTEFSIALDKKSAPTGKIVFNAKNDGAVAHELVVVRTDLAQDKLPIDTTAGIVDESKLTSLGEIEEFDAKKSESGTFTLAPGKFVIFCNVPAHYQAGMHTDFTVN